MLYLIRKQPFLFCCCLFILFSQFCGCYSYKNISREDYIKEKEHSAVKIVLKDKREIIVEKPEDLVILTDERKYLIKKGDKDSLIHFDNVSRISEYKYDAISSCLAGGTIFIGGVSVLIAIVSLIFIWINGPLKF